MSFDWLNVPGLSSDEGNVTVEEAGQMPPPSVSFNFGPGSAISFNAEQPANNSNQQPKQSLSGNVKTANGNWSGHPQASPNEQPKAHQNELVYSQHSNIHKSHKIEAEADIEYKETPDELRVPLSLSRSELTFEEVRTYLRWYNCITLRTHSKLVRLADVFRFLSNFNISEQLKERITLIFRTCKNALNIGQFFAVLRLVSKALIENKMPNRKMILEKAPIPKPRPILSSGAGQEVYEEVDEEPDDINGGKVDFDSFASLLLTGKSARKRIRRRITIVADKNKRVRFSEHLTFQEAPSSDGVDQKHEDIEENEESDKLDLSLPMDQLLKRMAKRKEKNSALVSAMPNDQQETEEEREVLEEMKDSLSHFKQIQTVDFASMAPGSVPSIVLDSSKANSDGNLSQAPAQALIPLKPTSTGSANHLFRQHYNPPQESQMDSQASLLPLKPTATGSANYLMRNQIPSQQHGASGYSPSATGSSPVSGLQPLKPTATGSGNYLMKQHFNQQFTQSTNSSNAANDVHGRSSPLYSGQLPPDPHLQAPQPSVSLQQQLSPQITPQSQNLQPQRQQQQQQQQHGVFSASNPAGSYFQSLLSHSPSPSSSTSNLPVMASGSPYRDMLPSNGPTSQSRATYNSGYQYSSPVPDRQQPMFTGSNQPQVQSQQLPQQLPQHQQNPQQFIPQQGFTNGFSAPRPYAMPTSASPRSGDILSDLQSLQQQVDALQSSYSQR
ncbi:hypothetical protein HG536_0F04010 [Torulaspora globosa]|uniref:Uncharacterized protein n=1 Tax=Torulaspora globosa TaxID=48254 RepID=A0A7G3ZKP0_9SACH|nr:uncharacterized protein HG536_0F04010 [Torulaspora globosa]QLL34076.1 hypothetical protein HG536_0F04010 [Torulaspora globosa]